MPSRRPVLSRVRAQFKREWRLLTLVIISGILVAGIFRVVENACHDYGGDGKFWKWEGAVQLFAGNWPNEITDHTTVWFAIFVAFRILLVIGAIGGVWTVFVKLRDIVELSTMKLSAVLSDRDFAVEMAVLQMFPPEERQRRKAAVHEAVQRGVDNWLHRYLRHTAPEDFARIQKQFEAGEI